MFGHLPQKGADADRYTGDVLFADVEWPGHQRIPLISHNETAILKQPKQELTDSECRALAQGQQIPGQISEDYVAWSGGVVQGILEPAEDGTIKARRWLSRGIRNPESKAETD